MSEFIHAPAEEWRLHGDAVNLASPGYEVIVKRLADEAKILDYRRETAKCHRAYFRVSVTLRCKRETISLFHSSRSGYRAQYYSSIRRGEVANEYALRSLVPILKRLLLGKEKRGCPWRWIEASLSEPSAKLWIHQGRWLRANARKDRNLNVLRWQLPPSSIDRDRAKKMRWSRLTPMSETLIELKGGFISLEGVPMGRHKASRSKDLHEFGFT